MVSDKEVADAIVNKAMAKIRDRKPAMSESKILTSQEVEAMLLTVRADGLTHLTLEQRDDLLATVRHLLSENERAAKHLGDYDQLVGHLRQENARLKARR